MAFLPMTRQEMIQRDWHELDFLMISGDAYVDHPSFGPALLGRLLEAEGYRVGIIAQPDINDEQSVLALGKPRLAVLVASGVVDSMVDNYTAARKPRSDDRYSPGGTGGSRPDRATIRYCNLIRATMGDVPLIIGGIEASLRRMAHYDYWDHKVRRSILQDSQADLLVYGMGELTLLKIASLLSRDVPVQSLTDLPGTCVLSQAERLPKKTQLFLNSTEDWQWQSDALLPEKAAAIKQPVKQSAFLDQRFPADQAHVLLPGFADVSTDTIAYALAFRMLSLEQDPKQGRVLIQPHGRRLLVQNPPQRPLTVKEMDRLYQLPYERKPHPVYDKQGGVPAIAEVGMSITAHRGCYGGCHFCAIGLHQGRIIQHRSASSILNEAQTISQSSDFKGYIHDVGGPTANFHQPACARQRDGTACRHRQCLFPEPCPLLEADHAAYLSVLEQIRQLPDIKKVFVRSGIRFDYLLLDQKNPFLEQLCEHHISGQLKVAPEHISRDTLKAMGKPGPDVYRTFARRYEETNQALGKEQYLVPYLISGHPGCTLDDAIELALEIKKRHVIPEQVQDFYPTPGTLSTTMYHTGFDPMTLETVYIPRGEEKAMQRALLQYSKPRSRDLAEKALRQAGRDDLIGFGPDALVKPRGGKAGDHANGDTKGSSKAKKVRAYNSADRKQHASGIGKNLHKKNRNARKSRNVASSSRDGQKSRHDMSENKSRANISGTSRSAEAASASGSAKRKHSSEQARHSGKPGRFGTKNRSKQSVSKPGNKTYQGKTHGSQSRTHRGKKR